MIEKIESEYNRFKHFHEKISDLLQKYLLEYGSFDNLPEDVKEKFCFLYEILEKSNNDLFQQLNDYENNLH
ncbi:MAG: hypothetical protein JW982_13105 [Spirochaetes bacterium]|nr:hypothetical protein [Spirochaetota bacterium]